MPAETDITQVLLSAIEELRLSDKLNLRENLTSLNPSLTLTRQGLDSLDVVELVMLLEERQGWAYEESQFKVFLYDTVEDLSKKLLALQLTPSA